MDARQRMLPGSSTGCRDVALRLGLLGLVALMPAWAQAAPPGEEGAGDVSTVDSTSGASEDAGEEQPNRIEERGAPAPEPAPPPPPDLSGTPSLPPSTPVEASSPRDGEAGPVLSYDGRAPAPPTARQALAWIPRILLAPAYLTSEYVLRRPLVALTRWGDQHHVWRRIYDFATWNEGQAGIYPSANIDLGLNQTAGFTLFWRGLGVPQNTLHVSAQAGVSVLSGSMVDRHRIFAGGSGALVLRAGYVRRPDGVFYGIGPDTVTSEKTFYGYVSRGASLGIEGALGGLSHIGFDVGYRKNSFSASDESPALSGQEAPFGGPGELPVPPGFGGYGLIQPRVGLVLDSRSPKIESTPGTGLRLETGAAFGIDPGDTQTRFVSWGARAEGFYDLTGARHVLGMSVGAQFVENIGTNDVPFPELPTLGGLTTLRGFYGGRFRGPSVIDAIIQYRYPFLALVDAELFSEVGNAFFGHLEGLRPARLFMSYGLGLRTTFARDAAISATIAFGSNRFDSPAFHPADSIRLALGVIYGF